MPDHRSDAAAAETDHPATLAWWARLLPDRVGRHIVGREGLMKVLRNTGWLVGEKALRLTVGVVVGAIVARYLGPSDFGFLNFAMALTTVLSPIAAFGIAPLIVRELVRAPQDRDGLIATSLVIHGLGGALTVVATLVAALAVRGTDTEALLIIGVVAGATVFQASDALDYFFQSEVASRFTVIARSAAFILGAVVRILLVVLDAPLIAFAIAGTAEVALASLILLGFYRREAGPVRIDRASTGTARRVLREGWPLVLSGFAIALYMRIDQVMLSELASDTATGVFAAAAKLSEAWYILPVALVASVAPGIAAAKVQDEQLYWHRIERLFQLLAALALLVAVPMTFLAEPITQFLYGSDYDGSGTILAIHIWTGVFVFLGVAQGPWFINEGLTRLTLQRTLLGAGVNIALNAILIPRHGGTGAAISTVAAQSVASVFANGLSARTRPVLWAQLRALLPIGLVRSLWR
jgi:PST family polysaccharide transporter